MGGLPLTKHWLKRQNMLRTCPHPWQPHTLGAAHLRGTSGVGLLPLPLCTEGLPSARGPVSMLPATCVQNTCHFRAEASEPVNKSLWPLLTAAESRSHINDLNSSLNDSHGGWKSKIKMPVGAGIGEGAPPALDGHPLLCAHGGRELFM